MKILSSEQVEIQAALLNHLRDDSAVENFNNFCHRLLAEILAEWEGKKLNKRIAEQFRLKLLACASAVKPADLRVVYLSEFGLIQLGVWGTPHHEHVSKRLVMFIAHTDTAQCFTIATFEHNDCCHGSAALERNAEREKAISAPELAEAVQLIDAIETAKARLNELLKYEGVLNRLSYIPRVYEAARTLKHNS